MHQSKPYGVGLQPYTILLMIQCSQKMFLLLMYVKSCAQGNNDNFYVGHCLKSCCIVSENAHNSTIYNLACTDTSKKYMADKN